MAQSKRGQGSSEYILIFGAVLVIGLVVVSLMNFTPSSASNTIQSESDLYWSAQAKPFLVQDAVFRKGAAWVCGNSEGQLILQMKNTDKFQLNLREIYLNGIPSYRFCAYNVSQENYTDGKNESFTAGQARLIWVPTNNYSGLCMDGKKSEAVQLAFKYDAPYLPDKIENGTMKLYINCGQDATPSVLCNETICNPGQSCCTQKNPNYCYNTVGGTCNSCGGACPGGQTCVSGSCLISCGGGYCDPSLDLQCCPAAGYSCISNSLTCDACGGSCDPKIQACCSGDPHPACIGNNEVCSDGRIACYGSLCISGVQECCDQMSSCAATGICNQCKSECKENQYCCHQYDKYMCINIEDHCEDECGGSCNYPKGEYCCATGFNHPICLPLQTTCDVCGGCDPYLSACCSDFMQCVPNGASCKDGRIACFGRLCEKGMFCNEKTMKCDSDISGI